MNEPLHRSPLAVETLIVRGNEIGFTGSVQPGTLSRYAEWARWAMFRQPDFVMRDRLGGGVARAQHAVTFAELTYPSELRIETRLARTGRTSLDLAHQFVRVEDGARIANLRVTIVQLGPAGPSPIDPTLSELVTPTDAPEPLPFVMPEGDTVFEWSIPARPSDQDQFRHVNQARYVDFADDVRWAAHAAGHPLGFEGPLGAYSVDYRREVRAGTTLRARLGAGPGSVRCLSLSELHSGIETTRIALAPRLP